MSSSSRILKPRIEPLCIRFAAAPTTCSTTWRSALVSFSRTPPTSPIATAIQNEDTRSPEARPTLGRSTNTLDQRTCQGPGREFGAPPLLKRRPSGRPTDGRTLVNLSRLLGGSCVLRTRVGHCVRAPHDGRSLGRAPHDGRSLGRAPHDGRSLGRAPHDGRSLGRAPHDGRSLGRAPHDGRSLGRAPHDGRLACSARRFLCVCQAAEGAVVESVVAGSGSDLSEELVVGVEPAALDCRVAPECPPGSAA